ncbi:MAG: hypothetical protein HUU55_19285 [Myxococcales bacterium]|nr:hypothetical protein [Myxococcales bacterium]
MSQVVLARTHLRKASCPTSVVGKQRHWARAKLGAVCVLLVATAWVTTGCNSAELRSIQEKSAALEKQNTELSTKITELQQKLESLETTSQKFQAAAAEFHTQTSGRLGYLESPSKVVQATAFEIVDSEKNKRAAFALSPTTLGVGFVMNDVKGVSRLLVRVDDKGPGLLFGDTNGVQRLVLGVPAVQPGQTGAPESSILLMDDKGKPIWTVGGNAAGITPPPVP